MSPARSTSICLLALLSSGCGGTNEAPAYPQGAHGRQGGQLGQASPGPMGLPVPPGVLGALANVIPPDAPCPPPWLPPQAAALVDCAALRRASGASIFIPRAVAAAALPPTSDLRWRGLVGPVKDQAQVGACAGFAVSSVLDNVNRRMGRGDVSSPLHVFASYSEQADLGALRGRYITGEEVWPYDPARACAFASASFAEGCSSYYGVPSDSWRRSPQLVGERQRADQYGRVPVTALEEIRAPLDPVQLAALLADGEAVWASLAFERAVWSSLENNRGSLLPPTMYPESAHAVVIVGYRPGPFGREYIFQNSWGRDWADGGFAYVPESELVNLWRHGYRVRTDPVAGLGPAASSCPSGSSVLMGLCVPGVPMGAAPIAWPGLGSSSDMGGATLPACAGNAIPTPFGCVGI
jgi:hypothetical protein